MSFSEQIEIRYRKKNLVNEENLIIKNEFLAFLGWRCIGSDHNPRIANFLFRCKLLTKDPTHPDPMLKD